MRGWWRTLRRDLPPADLYHAFGILAIPVALDAGATDALDGLIARCLAKRPDERFQKVSELSAALQLFGPPSGAVHLSFPPVRGSSSPPAPDS